MSIQFLINGSTQARFVNAVELKESAQDMGWDTSWWENKANRAICRAGKDPSDAWVLLYYSDFSQCTQTSTQTIRLSNCADGNDQADVNLQGWIIRDAWPIDPSMDFSGAESGTYDNQTVDPVPYFTPHDDQVYLVHLQDRRAWMAQSTFEGEYNVLRGVRHDPVEETASPSNNTDYNVFDWYTDTLNGGTTPYTWNEILTDLRANHLKLGATLIGLGSFDPPDSGEPDPITYPINIHSAGRSAWDLFYDLLLATGHTLSYNVGTGGVAVVPLTPNTGSGAYTTINALLEEITVAAGTNTLIESRVIDRQHQLLPQNIRILYPSRIYNVESPASTEEIVPLEITQTADVHYDESIVTDVDSTSIAATPLTETYYHVYAEGALYFTTTRYEQASPSPANRRETQISSHGPALAGRYVKNLQTLSVEYLFYGAVDIDPDATFPYVEYDFSMLSGHPTTTRVISGPAAPHWHKSLRSSISREGMDLQETPITKWAYVRPNGDIDAGESGTCYFLHPDPTDVSSTETLDFSTLDISDSVWNATEATLTSGTRYLAMYDYRLDRWVVPTGSAAQAADELRCQVNSYNNAGTASNTYGTIVAKTSSPAPLPLPSGTPSISGTVYIADIHAFGSSYFKSGDVIRAIRSVGIDTYSATPVNWEHCADISHRTAMFVNATLTEDIGATTSSKASASLVGYWGPLGQTAAPSNPLTLVALGDAFLEIKSGTTVLATLSDRTTSPEEYTILAITDDIAIPFTCMVTASLTAASWDSANNRLTPAANTNACVLLDWDAGNSRWDEATGVGGTAFSPDWASTAAVTVGSGEAFVGRGVYYKGRYQLITVDCPDNSVTY